MGVKVTTEIQCDVCGRIPGPPPKEMIENCKGTAFYPIDDSDQYGRLGLHPEHLTLTNMGHNAIPNKTISFCVRDAGL